MNAFQNHAGEEEGEVPAGDLDAIRQEIVVLQREVQRLHVQLTAARNQLKGVRSRSQAAERELSRPVHGSPRRVRARSGCPHAYRCPRCRLGHQG